MGGGGKAEVRVRRRGGSVPGFFALALAAVSAQAALAVVPGPGDLLVVDRSASGGALLLVKRQTGTVSVVSAGGNFVDPRRVAVADDGMLYVVDAGGQNPGKVIRVDPRDGSQTVVVSADLATPTGIALAPGAIAFLTQQTMPSPPLVRANLANGTVTPLLMLTDQVAPSDVARETAGTLVIVDPGNAGGVIFRVDPASQKETIIETTLSRPQAVAIEADGGIVVAAGSGTTAGLYLLGEGTDPPTPVSLGGKLRTPVGVAASAFGTLFVADRGSGIGSGAVVAVDPETSAQTTVASGAPFEQPHGIAVVTHTGPVCGNGILDGVEACDQGDANGGPNACCGLDCRLLVATVPCPAQTNFCGTQADGVACIPNDECVTGATCHQGVCGGGTTTCAAAAEQRTTAKIRVDCTVNGDPRQPCVVQGFAAAEVPADAAAPVPLAVDCSAAGVPATAAVQKRTNRQNRARVTVQLRACARRQLRKAGEADVIMVIRMGDGEDIRTVMRRLRLLKKKAAS
jgi:sugar lactone lactonase YvrE